MSINSWLVSSAAQQINKQLATTFLNILGHVAAFLLNSAQDQHQHSLEDATSFKSTIGDISAQIASRSCTLRMPRMHSMSKDSIAFDYVLEELPSSPLLIGKPNMAVDGRSYHYIWDKITSTVLYHHWQWPFLTMSLEATNNGSFESNPCGSRVNHCNVIKYQTRMTWRDYVRMWSSSRSTSHWWYHIWVASLYC